MRISTELMQLSLLEHLIEILVQTQTWTNIKLVRVQDLLLGIKKFVIDGSLFRKFFVLVAASITIY